MGPGGDTREGHETETAAQEQSDGFRSADWHPNIWWGWEQRDSQAAPRIGDGAGAVGQEGRESR